MFTRPEYVVIPETKLSVVAVTLKYQEDRIHYYGILAFNLKLQAEGHRLYPPKD